MSFIKIDKIIEKIDFSNIVKLFRKGDIHKVYSKMFDTADFCAVEELKRYIPRLETKTNRNLMNHEDFIKFVDKIAKYRDQRFKYHMEQMKELLKIRLKEN